MLCDICGKAEATVHLTEIVDEQMTELHLCDECARKKSIEMEQQFGLSDLLAGLVDLGKQAEGQNADKTKCSNCGLSYGDFKKIGRLGCSQCYDTFSKYLAPLLRKIHGASVHTGKTPASFPVSEPVATKKNKVKKILKPAEEELLELKEKLQIAITQENFEEAALLRDKIKELEKKIK